MSFRNLNRN